MDIFLIVKNDKNYQWVANHDLPAKTFLWAQTKQEKKKA
jgi:hypothetical protein